MCRSGRVVSAVAPLRLGGECEENAMWIWYMFGYC